MKKIAILQSNYIPWKGYFDIIRRSDVFVIYDEVQYTKNDWRNRNLIKTNNGTQWITIPVSQKNLSQKINEMFFYTEHSVEFERIGYREYYEDKQLHQSFLRNTSDKEYKYRADDKMLSL